MLHQHFSWRNFKECGVKPRSLKEKQLLREAAVTRRNPHRGELVAILPREHSLLLKSARLRHMEPWRS